MNRNIALNKPSNQTGTFNDMTADKAVDGNLDTCAHPNADYFVRLKFWSGPAWRSKVIIRKPWREAGNA